MMLVEPWASILIYDSSDVMQTDVMYDNDMTDVLLVLFVFFKMFLANIHMSYFGATGSPVLDFWSHLLWFQSQSGFLFTLWR